MRGIEYYREYLHLLEDACNTGRKNYSYEYGSEHIGDYWLAICQDLRERNLALNDRGDLQIRQLPPLVSLMAEFREQIEILEKADYDRNLYNTESEANIKYGKKGYKIAKAAIFISIAAFLLELIKWWTD